MSNESTTKIFKVAFTLCLVCSLLVSTAAVGLKPLQEANKENERKENILKAAGIYVPDVSVDELFKQIDSHVVELATGEYTNFDPATFEQRKAAQDKTMNVTIPADKDIAGIGQRSRYANVYLLKKNGRIKRVILPVHGKGLWSTMYGFIALGPDLNTVKNFGFYEHAETPGLGGEIDNPKWKSLWVGKKIFDKTLKPIINVIKGSVDTKSINAPYQVDGLAGATLTGRGVAHLVRYWLGEGGFTPYLKRLANNGGITHE